MKNKNILLLKILLLATSQRNILKHTKDKKKKKKAVGAFIGMGMIYLMLMAYSIFMCIGYGLMGMIDETPKMCALIISAMAFMFTVFKTNGYLFNFKEYDMLMSLPFKDSSVAACKFFYMYVKSLSWYLSISVAMMLGYGIFARPGILTYIAWIILSFFLPIIPMLFASLIGFIIARISAGFRKTNIIQTILTFIFIIFCFSLRYIIEALLKDGQVEDTLEKTSQITGNIAAIYLPMGWFSDAMIKGSVLAFILFIAATVLLFMAVFYLVGRSYRNINSALKSHAAAKRYKMSAQKKRSVLQAIAYKEFKRMVGSTTYFTNVAVGHVMAVLLGIVALIFGFDKIVKVVTQGAPFDSAILYPAIPFIVYFLVGMMSSCACSPSLEGKNYWIVQSLPIEKKTLYRGKMLFNMYLTVPFMLIGILCLCISARVQAPDLLLYLILGIIMCAFSTTWGCVCGVKHLRLDWENEVEVIKQGAGVAIYMFPNMIVSMGLAALVVFLGTIMPYRLVTLIFVAVYGALAFVCYLWVMKLSEKN